MVTDDDGFVQKLVLNWGDGTPAQLLPGDLIGCRPSGSGWPSQSMALIQSHPVLMHPYAAPGTYQVTLTAVSTACDGSQEQRAWAPSPGGCLTEQSCTGDEFGAGPTSHACTSHPRRSTMPTRESAPNGAPCWVDLMTSDVARARDFYGQLFGWTSNEPSEEFGGYFMFEKDGIPVAGGMPTMPDAGPPNIWSVYLSTDDAEKAVEVATAIGAQVIAPAMDVAGLGTMAVLIDPTGAAIGMWQPGTFGGITVLAEPGTPGWFELLTRDHAGAVEFYRAVFGWDTRAMSDTDEFRYTTANDGDTMLCGVMDASSFLPEGVPAHWSVYFTTADTDATIATLTGLGGSVEQPAEDTPYGRIAVVTDPMGARFKLVGPNEQMPAT